MNRWRRVITTITARLSVEALRERYVSSSNPREARHFQTIWLLAKGHSVGEVVAMTSFGRRWIEPLVVRIRFKCRSFPVFTLEPEAPLDGWF